MILVSQDLNELILAIRDRKDYLADTMYTLNQKLLSEKDDAAAALIRTQRSREIKSYDCLESLELELQGVANFLARAEAVLEDSDPKDVPCVNVSADLTTLSKLSEELLFVPEE